MNLMDVLVNYFQAILQDGDWLNDWLTHIADPVVRTFIHLLGFVLALLVGR